MAVRKIIYGGTDSFSVTRTERDGYTLWFANSGEPLAVTNLNKANLVEIKRTITERQRLDRQVA